ncbi:MAG: hypothetical protein WAV20_12980, partial [Blastocatellia bacterium]
ARPPVEQPAVDSKPTPEKPGDAPVEGALEPKTAQPKASEATVTADESSWRERVNKARDRAKEVERAAEETEIRITTLRNDLGVSGQSARYRNDTAAELEQAGQRLSQLRVESRAAAADVAHLVEYGKQRGFTEADDPKPTSAEGKPNEQYYRSQLARLTEAIDSSHRRVQLYDNRVRDISQHILLTGGKNGGDNFYIMQLQQDREEAQRNLDEARAALAKAQTDLDALKEEARRAGVPPGLFR